MQRTDEYKFHVERDWYYDFTGVAKDANPTKKIYNYAVSLPHSSDEWVITEGVGKLEAIKEMEQFIEEARKALNKLKSL